MDNSPREAEVKAALKEFEGQEDTPEVRAKMVAKVQALAEDHATEDSKPAPGSLLDLVAKQDKRAKSRHPGSKRPKATSKQKRAKRLARRAARRKGR